MIKELHFLATILITKRSYLLTNRVCFRTYIDDEISNLFIKIDQLVDKILINKPLYENNVSIINEMAKAYSYKNFTSNNKQVFSYLI